MTCQPGMKLIVGFLIVSPLSGFGQQTGIGRGVPITVVVHDRTGIMPESLAVAKEVVIRVMSAGGFDVKWIDTVNALNTYVALTDSSEQAELSPIRYLSIVITPSAYPGSGPNEGGFAAVTAGRYPRAYVFLDQVKAFSAAVTRFSGGRIVGTVLGHVICHELGHLLMPGKPHAPFGIMRGDWDSEQWTEAVQGLLLFSGRQAEIMRDHIRDHCSASLAGNRRLC